MKTLRAVNPEAAKMWCYELNGDLTPDSISYTSNKKAYFRCLDNPKHLFYKPIRKMTSDRDMHNIGCIYCSPNAKVAFPGETDFFTKVPEAVDVWDYAQNELLGLNPKELLPYSSKKAHFLCANGHDEFRKIADFTNFPSCQTCRKSLLINAPSTTLFLNEKYNTAETIKDYIPSDRRLLELACPNCDYTWSWRAFLWYERKYCPHCGYDGTDGSCEKNSFVKDAFHIITLRDANPEMASLWDYEKNGDATPDNTHGQSNNKYYFNCKNGHNFNIELYNLYDKNGSPLGCPFCQENTRRISVGINDLVTKVPKILDYWDFDNNDISPNSISAVSAYEAKLKCDNGHKFTRKINLFISDMQCPECKKLEHIQKYSIEKLRPESYRFWDFERNSLDPSLTSAYSQEDAFWKCPDCGYEWKQKIFSRCSSRAGKCPSHDLKRVFSQDCELKFMDSFACKNPEASKYWNHELNNGLTPENTPKSSGKEIYMNCSLGKHNPYLIKVCNIKTFPYGCPDCQKEKKEKSYRINSLKLNVPISIDMWDYQNNKISLENALIYMNESANFICKEGHSFARPISSFVTNQDCPICKMDTVVKYPYLVKQWHFKKNSTYDINLTSANSKDTVWWKCKKCGYEWQAQILSRKASAGHCPCCEERTIVVKGITDLFTMVPDIKDLYDFKTNTNINPDELSVTSNTKINWKCDKCGYKWKTSVTARIIYDNGKYLVRKCPSCVGQIRTISYGQEYPELAEKFEEKLNGCSLFDIFESKYQAENYFWHCDICNEIFESSLYSMIRARKTKSKGCSFCAGKRVTIENSFAFLHPEVMDEYDSTNEIDPYAVTEKSNQLVKWICRNNPEHKWKAAFYMRADGMGGCNICRGYNYGMMFHKEHSDFEKYYDSVKNERPFESYSNSSNEIVWWKCNKKHSFKRSIINFSRSGIFKCPICDNKQLLVGTNDLETRYPDLAQEFDSVKNNMLPNNILFTNTDNSIWWLCKEGHSFQRSIWHRVNSTRACPVCNRELVIKGINDFETKYPNINNIWDYELNEKTPDTISDRNNGKYSFACQKGHHYEAALRAEIYNDFQCLVCTFKLIQLGVNSLIDTDAELAKEWSPNDKRKPYEFHKHSKYNALWECPTCHGDYLYSINERKIGDDSCPYCKNRRVLTQFNSLYAKDRELAKEWSLKNERSAKKVLRTSTKYGLWNCPICHGEYPYCIKERYLGDNSCPYCNNKKPLPGFNSLVDVDEKLSKEWSIFNKDKPSEYLRDSSYAVLWTCPRCKGDYSYSIRNRKVGDNSCPYCNNKKLLPGFNSLADVDEELSKEWSVLNKGKPSEYLRISSYVVLWTCPRCKGDYSYPICNRKVGDNSCPYCNNKKVMPGLNSLAIQNKDLMAEWNYKNNYLIVNPDTILPTYSENVWWTCKCGKNYKMSPKKRLYYQKRNMQSCPYCKGRRRKKYRNF